MLQYYRTMLLWKNLSEYLKLEKGFYARKRTETIKRKAKRRRRKNDNSKNSYFRLFS